MNKRTATLRTADGEEHTAAIEEPVGTDLPALSPGAEATVWVSDRGRRSGHRGRRPDLGAVSEP